MKKIVPLLVVLVLSAMLSITVFGASGSWQKDDHGWWYLDQDGSFPADSWKLIDDEWYHFDKDGYMQTGWLQINDDRFYLDESGVLQIGWFQVEDVWYYADEYGILYTGIVVEDTIWYFVDETGIIGSGLVSTYNESGYYNVFGVWTGLDEEESPIYLVEKYTPSYNGNSGSNYYDPYSGYKPVTNPKNYGVSIKS